MRKNDPIDLFMQWYSYDKPHMSLNRDERRRQPKRLCAGCPRRERPLLTSRRGRSIMRREGELLSGSHTRPS